MSTRQQGQTNIFICDSEQSASVINDPAQPCVRNLPETNEFIFNFVRIQATLPSFRFSDLIILYPQTDQPTNKHHHPVDSEICKSAVTQKIDLQKQLYSVLQGEVKPSGSLTSSGKAAL